MKAITTSLRILFASMFLLQGLALAADTNADGASILSTMSKAKGLIARVPVNANGEVDTSGVEYRVDTGNVAVTSKESLATAFDQAADIKGYAEVSKPKTDSADSSTGYYYYQPYVYWTTYTWTFTYPVYVYYPVYYYYVPVTYVYYYYVIY